MPAQASGIGDGREEHDRIAAELDIVLQNLSLLDGQGAPGRVEVKGLEGIQVDGEVLGIHR